MDELVESWGAERGKVHESIVVVTHGFHGSLSVVHIFQHCATGGACGGGGRGCWIYIAFGAKVSRADQIGQNLILKCGLASFILIEVLR